MKWFRKISMKIELEVDYSGDYTSYQNEIFTVPISEHLPISDIDLSSTPPVFYKDRHKNGVDYVINDFKNLNYGDKNLRESLVDGVDKYEISV